jgi:hypothetical protein
MMAILERLNEMKMFPQLCLGLVLGSLVWMGGNSSAVAMTTFVDAVPPNAAQSPDYRVPATLTLVRTSGVSDLGGRARPIKLQDGNTRSEGIKTRLWIVDSATGQVLSQYAIENERSNGNSSTKRSQVAASQASL